jgi:hypothetical protein
MKNLGNTPTRPLDYFELVGLEHLMKGGEVFVRSKENVVRVLGSIRAAKQCLKCHGDAKEKDLLGAFSYTVRAGEYRLSKGPAWNVGPFPELMAVTPITPSYPLPKQP